MSPEKDKALCDKYPRIFADRHGDMRETAMYWGFECGDGWYDLIDRLCAALMAAADSASGHVPVATQVKEKFGGLRFYVMSATDEQFDLISAAGKASLEICETCGQPGKVYTDGWLTTLCPTHAAADGREDDGSEEP